MSLEKKDAKANANAQNSHKKNIVFPTAAQPRTPQRSVAVAAPAGEPKARRDESAAKAKVPRRRSGEVALGNTQVAFPVSSTKREERWKMRENLREITKLPRPRKCGKVPIAPLISLRANADGARAGFGGLTTCGSVWVCPVCSAKIASRRKTELEQVLQHATRHGYKVSMLTLTQRHHNGQKLKTLWNGLSHAWNRVTSGRRWAEFKTQLDLVGYVRATEVTHGKHGWHVHNHVLIISKNDPTNTPIFYQRKQGRAKKPYPLEVIMPSDYVAERWQAGLKKYGIDFIKNKGGLDWEVAKDPQAMALYVAKMQTENQERPKSSTDRISSEATLGGFKRARGENRTPFQILADIFENGDADDIEIWYEYEEVSHGKRALTWSKGLREWAKLGQELTDEEIAEEEIGDEVIATFDHDAWKAVRRAGAANLLDITESKGIDAAFEWLDYHQINYQLPPKLVQIE